MWACVKDLKTNKLTNVPVENIEFFTLNYAKKKYTLKKNGEELEIQVLLVADTEEELQEKRNSERLRVTPTSLLSTAEEDTPDPLPPQPKELKVIVPNIFEILENKLSKKYPILYNKDMDAASADERNNIHEPKSDEKIENRSEKQAESDKEMAPEEKGYQDDNISMIESLECINPESSYQPIPQTSGNNKHDSRKRRSSKHSDDEHGVSHKRMNVRDRNSSHRNSSPPCIKLVEKEKCANRSPVHEKSSSRSRNSHRRNSDEDYNKISESNKGHGSSDRNRSSSMNKDRSSIHIQVNANSDRGKRNERKSSRTREEDKGVQVHTFLRKILENHDRHEKKTEKLEKNVKEIENNVKATVKEMETALKAELSQVLTLLSKYDSIAEENKTKPEPFMDGSGLPAVGFTRYIPDSDKQETHIGQDKWIDYASWCMVRNRAGASESKFIKGLMSIIYTSDEIINSSALGQVSNREKVVEKRPALDPIRMLALQDSLTWYKQMHNEGMTLVQCRIDAEEALKEYVGSKITDSRKPTKPRKPANEQKKKKGMMKKKKTTHQKNKAMLATKNVSNSGHSNSHDRSQSRSRSQSHSRSYRSRSRSRSCSRRSRSRSLSRSRSRSRSRSHSRSCSRSRSRSRSHSRSHSRSRSCSRSRVQK